MESTTPNCPSCGQTLPGRGVFCPFCAAQARCKSCREVLEPRAVACVECGTRYGEGYPALSGGIGSITQAPNVMRLEETRTSRSFEARFTDSAVDSLSMPLSAYLGGGLYNAHQKRVRAARSAGGELAEEQLPLLTAGEAEFVDVMQAAPPSAPTSHGEVPDDEARLHNIFSYTGDRLRLKDPRIKSDTKIEYVGRLICLFFYAHELANRPKVSRATLNTLLAEAALNDGNTRNWIATTKDLMTDGEMIELSVPGREKATETLRRNEDPSITGTYVLGASSRSRAAKPDSDASGDAEGNAKTGKRRSALDSKKVTPWVDQWKAAGVPVNAYEALTGKSSAEKGLFGLWAIRKALGENGRVVSRLQLAQFLYQAFEIKVNDATLGQALKGPGMKDRVINVEGTRFQITPAGMASIDQMVGQQSGPSST